MVEYYDKQGKKITTTKKWAELLADSSYKIIKQQTTEDGKRVSTVWLGLDHRMGEGKPLIFETMVFPRIGCFPEIDMERYSTLEEAKSGHKKMFNKFNKTNEQDRGK